MHILTSAQVWLRPEKRQNKKLTDEDTKKLTLRYQA